LNRALADTETVQFRATTLQLAELELARAAPELEELEPE